MIRDIDASLFTSASCLTDIDMSCNHLSNTPALEHITSLIQLKRLNLANNQLTKCIFQVNGKSTNKDEFVTAGGVDLKEVDFKTMQSKLLPNLYFGGEVMNIDAITGGFNFQAAWTTAWIAAQSI
jgi:predicted flavoprotein YhiN